MDSLNYLKKQAAQRAVQEVESGMILGLGTGSTARFAIEEIGERHRKGELLNILAVASSIKTAKLAQILEIPLTTLAEHPVIDLTIDGADEVNPDLDLIKGGGGALLREKILMQASRRNVIIIDETKYSPRLGRNWAVPVEVIAFARQTEENYLKSLGASVRYRRDDNNSLFKTDQGNLILDANFGPIENPKELAGKLNERAGIAEHGLFIGLAHQVVIAGENGLQLL